jgi:integrase
MEYLPLSDQAIALLREMKKENQSSYLFPGKVLGKPLQEIKNAWATILKLAGLKSVRVHDLRHTHASHLVSDGEDLYTVGKLLGHTQVSTTKKYAHLAHQPLKRATMSFGNKIERLTTKTTG